ncbi:hypothetical protein [Streptomyces sp. NPDC090445]|uniref:hypothetical protein n=1 Tax=Streptomyces sp. NPDC090445 TaxID=3365963 RepID=UPI003819DC97
MLPEQAGVPPVRLRDGRPGSLPGELALHAVVWTPVEVLTPRMFVPPDGSWSPVWATMRELAAAHGAENVRLIVWFG